MYLLESEAITVLRGDAARHLAQRTILSARRILPEFRDICSPEAVRRFAYLLDNSLGEPSYTSDRPVDGPVQIWVVSLKNANGILSFELWEYAETPRYYIFVDRPSPVIAKFLKRLRRYLYSPFFVIQ